MEDYHNIMVNNGHSNVQLWATEFGWATWDARKTMLAIAAMPVRESAALNDPDVIDV